MPRVELSIAPVGNTGNFAENLAGNIPDIVDGNSFVPGDDVYLFCWALAGGTLTVQSVPDASGRVASDAQEQKTFLNLDRFIRGPFPAHLFAQSDGLVHVDSTTASARIQPIRLTPLAAMA